MRNALPYCATSYGDVETGGTIELPCIVEGSSNSYAHMQKACIFFSEFSVSLGGTIKELSGSKIWEFKFGAAEFTVAKNWLKRREQYVETEDLGELVHAAGEPPSKL